MRRFLSCLTLILLAQPGAAQLQQAKSGTAQPQPAAVGIITDITKDVNTPTGAITISLPDQTTKTFVVNEATKFEIHRGKERRGSNFLAEHRGERAAIFLATGNATTAGRVNILLPAPPPPLNPPQHIIRAKPQPGDVHGTITAVDPKSVTMLLHEPPAVHVGTVTDIGYNQNNELGWLTIQTAKDKTEKFIVNAASRFHKVTGNSIASSNFLAADKGQSVVVFPASRGHHHVAAKVDIILDGHAMAKHHARYHSHHHWVTFLLAPDTTFARSRDGHHHSTTLKDVMPGEHVSILPTGIHSHIAKNINVLLPHAVHGIVTGFSPAALKVKVHHHQNLLNPAHNTEVIFPLSQGTAYKIDYKKAVQPAAAAALYLGARVAVYPAGPPPHGAEMVDIHLEQVHAHGKIAAVNNGIVSVMVHYAPKGKPAFDKAESFQVAAGTKIELHKGKERALGSVGDLMLGRTVTVHGHSGFPPIAEHIEVAVVIPRPVTVHGKLAGGANGMINVMVHHAATRDKPAHVTNDFFAIGGNTRIEIHQGKKSMPGNAASLVPGVEVTVHGHTGTPATAARIEVRIPIQKVNAKK